jgi:hypothetical protein
VFALVAQALALDSVQGQSFLPRKCRRPMISSRSFFRFNSISAILCSKVLCSSGICWFLSELLYCREVDSLLAKSPAARTQRAFLDMIALGDGDRRVKFQQKYENRHKNHAAARFLDGFSPP